MFEYLNKQSSHVRCVFMPLFSKLPYIDHWYVLLLQVLQFPSNCVQCEAACTTNMKTVDIPKFKQVIIMAMVCDNCGYRDNEVKSGTGIAEKGHKLTLCIRDTIDLSRDVLKVASFYASCDHVMCHQSVSVNTCLNLILSFRWFSFYFDFCN